MASRQGALWHLGGRAPWRGGARRFTFGVLQLTGSAGVELLLRYGVEYDHSFSHQDDQCYWVRTGDQIKPVDYNKHPNEWMTPLKRGKNTGLVEIPSNWYLDDLPPMVCT